MQRMFQVGVAVLKRILESLEQLELLCGCISLADDKPRTVEHVLAPGGTPKIFLAKNP